MSNGIRSLPRYQQGGVTLPDPEEERRQRLWDLMVERRDASSVGDKRGGIASLVGGIVSNPVSSLRRLSSLLFPLGPRRRESGERGVDPEVSESIYNAITPWVGEERLHKAEIIDALGRIARGDPGERQRMDAWVTPGREDAWRTYLELPQESGTFKEAEFRPTRGSGEDIRTFDFAEPYRVLDALDSGYRGIGMSNPDKRQIVLEELLKDIERAGGPVSRLDTRRPAAHRDLGVMGTYSLDKGEDEGGPYLSYYDKWDLAPEIAQISRAGRPFDIYGRMYYDPETYEYRGSND